MNCQRALTALRGLEANQLNVEFDEIEMLLGLGLVVEADPDDLALASWLEPVLRQHGGTWLGDPRAADLLGDRLRETEAQLKSDWYRMKTNKAELAKQEAERITMRRAHAILRDPHAMAPLAKIASDTRSLAPRARYVCCQALGSEHYALTHKGWRARSQLELRQSRFANASLKAFLHAFDKAEQKMHAFSNEIATLSANVGYVKKNREQIVIGLAKTGGPAAQAATSYHAALRATNTPDEAVTCTRNAATFGGTAMAAQRLKESQRALMRVGFSGSPIVLGAAKSLLGFALEPGVLRFVEIHKRLEGAIGRGHNEILVKFTARLMPAAGLPKDIVGRVVAAASSLALQSPNRERAARKDVRASAVALASMVRTQEAVPEIVSRFRQVEAELVRTGISTLHTAEPDALECVSCPGTPAEVVATVSALLDRLAAGRQRSRGDVAIACAFAKRFAF
jgi:hypothetical protein